MARSLGSRPPDSLVIDEFVVRRYVDSDARALMDSVTRSREHLRPWMPWIKFEPLDVRARRKLIREWDDAWNRGEDFPMGIFVGDVVVGGTGFHLRGEIDSVDIGYWVHVDFVGRGIIRRVVKALTTCALQMDEIQRVVICHDEANVSSRKVPEALGFQIFKKEQQEPQAPGECGTHTCWEMTRDVWLRRD